MRKTAGSNPVLRSSTQRILTHRDPWGTQLRIRWIGLSSRRWQMPRRRRRYQTAKSHTFWQRV